MPDITARGGVRSRCAVCALQLPLLTMLLCLFGCHGGDARLSLSQRADMKRRALDLLLRAGESEFDDVAAHALEALADVAPDEGTPLFRRALASDRPLIRYAGLVSLGRLNKRDALPAIRKCIRDQHAHVRLAAAFAALRCGGSEQTYGPLLADALSDSPEENLRAEAAALIGRLGERRAVKRLQLAQRREKSSLVLVQIVGALATLGDENAFQRLLAYTQGDQAARVVALQLLVELADPRARDALLDRLHAPADSEYIVVKLLAARGLGRIGSDAGFKLALTMADERTAVDVRDDAQRFEERMKIRTNAALALGAIGDQRALPHLQNLAQLQDDPRIQVAACWAILDILGD